MISFGVISLFFLNYFVRLFAANIEFFGVKHNFIVKDVNKFAKLGDIIYAKILDVDVANKHVKLSIKATLPKTRYRSSNRKKKNAEKYSSFTALEEKLNVWIIEQLKEKKKYD